MQLTLAVDLDLEILTEHWRAPHKDGHDVLHASRFKGVKRSVSKGFPQGGHTRESSGHEHLDNLASRLSLEHKPLSGGGARMSRQMYAAAVACVRYPLSSREGMPEVCILSSAHKPVLAHRCIRTTVY